MVVDVVLVRIRRKLCEYDGVVGRSTIPHFSLDTCDFGDIWKCLKGLFAKGTIPIIPICWKSDGMTEKLKFQVATERFFESTGYFNLNRSITGA